MTTISARKASLDCLRSLPADELPIGQVLTTAHVQAILYVGDALTAVADALKNQGGCPPRKADQ